MPDDKCPQCHHEWHRISDHPVYTFEPPGPDDSPYGRATAVKVHIPGGMECLKTQLDQAKARIAELEAENARIPPTADGTRIWPGDRLWYITRLHPEPLWIDVDHWCWCKDDGVTTEAVVWGESQHEPMDSLSASVCYRTREAALAAKENGNG